MIDRNHALPIARQAELVGISRGNVYYLARAASEADQRLMKRIDALNLAHPFMGRGGAGNLNNGLSGRSAALTRA